MLPSAQSAWTQGGLGKLQFDGGGHRGLDLTSNAVADLRVQAMPEVSGLVSLRLAPDQKTALDVTQAYARLQPIATSAWNLSVKLGAFFPPDLARERGRRLDQPVDAHPLGDQQLGRRRAPDHRRRIDARMAHGLGRARRSPARSSAGTIRLARCSPIAAGRSTTIRSACWTMSACPTRSRRGSAHRCPLWSSPIARSMTSPAGMPACPGARTMSAGSVCCATRTVPIPRSPVRGEFAWRTEFTSLGVETYLGDVVILAQAMSGLTEIAPAPTFNSTTYFQSAYLLAGIYLGDWRLAARVDGFATQEHHPGSFGVNLSEHGSALALAATWNPERWLRVTAEVLYVASLRGERIAAGLPARVNESPTSNRGAPDVLSRTCAGLGISQLWGLGGWRRTGPSPTRSGPEGSSRNEFRPGSLSSLPPSPMPASARRHDRAGQRLSRAGAQIPAAALRRADRPGSDGAHADQRHRHRPHRACLHPHRRARRRQDHDRAHPGARPQLHRPRRQGRPDRSRPAACAIPAAPSPRTAMST